VFEEPVFEEPVSEEPVSEEPVFEEPAPEDPVLEAMEISTPGNGVAGTRAGAGHQVS
jgi:hypothetical protein